MADIDQLEIEISAESSDAAQKVDALASALQRLKSALQGGGLDSVPKRIQEIGEKAQAAMPEKTRKRQNALQRVTAGMTSERGSGSLSDLTKEVSGVVKYNNAIAALDRQVAKAAEKFDKAFEKAEAMREQMKTALASGSLSESDKLKYQSAAEEVERLSKAYHDIKSQSDAYKKNAQAASLSGDDAAAAAKKLQALQRASKSVDSVKLKLTDQLRNAELQAVKTESQISRMKTKISDFSSKRNMGNLDKAIFDKAQNGVAAYEETAKAVQEKAAEIKQTIEAINKTTIDLSAENAQEQLDTLRAKLEGLQNEYKDLQHAAKLSGEQAKAAIAEAEKSTVSPDTKADGKGRITSIFDAVSQAFSGTKIGGKIGGYSNLISELDKVSVSAGNASAAAAEVGTSAAGAGAAGASAMASLAAAVGPVVAVLEILKQKFNENKEFLQSDRSLWTDTSWANAGEGLTNLGAALMTVNPELKAGVYALRSFIQPGQELLGVLGNLAQNGFQKAGGALKDFAASGFEKAGESVKSFVGKVGNGLKSVGTHVGQQIIKPFANAITTMQKWQASLGRLIFYRAINAAIRTVSEGIRTGIDNLYQFSSMADGRFANSMNSLASSSMYLKNSLGAMAAPLINAVAPAIDFIISKLVTLINLIGMVFAVLTGAGSFTKATKAAVGYGDALGGAGGAAKDLQDYLLGIDELNVIKPSGGGGGGGGGGGLGFGDMFEEVPLPDWAKAMQEAIAKGDWYGAGAILANHLNSIVDSWDPYPWGKKLGEKITHGLDFALGFLRTFKWDNFGKKLAEGINGLADGIEWETLGRVIGAGWNAVFDFAYGVFTTLEWGKFGQDISAAFNGWQDEIKWHRIAQTINEGFIGLFTMIDEALRGIRWGQLGQNLAVMLNNIDWDGIIFGFVQVLQDAIRGAARAIQEFVRVFEWDRIANEIADGINKGIHNMSELEWQEIGQILGSLFERAFHFARTTLKKIDWTQLGRDIAAFLKGIDWPGVLGELGGLIAEGFNAAIDTTWETVSDPLFWSRLGDGVESGLGEFLSNIHIGKAVTGLSIAITEAINMAIRAVNTLVSNDTFWSDLQNGIVSGINYFFNNVSPEEMANSITGLLKRVLETASKAIGAIAANASWWEEFGTSIGRGINNMIASKDFDSLLTDLARIAQSVLNGISNALNEVDWDAAWAKIKAAFDQIDWDSILESALEFFKTTFFAKMDMKLFEGGLLLQIGGKIASELGKAMMEGLESIPILGWFVLLGESIVTIFKDVGQIVMAALSGRWHEIPGLVKQTTDDIHGIVDKWGQKIHGTTDGHMQETEDSISQHMGAGRDAADTLLTQMQAGVSQKLQLVKDDTDTKMGLISGSITDGFEKARANSLPVIEAIGTGVSTGFEAMRSVVQKKTESIASTSKTNWGQTKTDTVSNLKDMSSSTDTQYNSMKNAVRTNLSEAESTSQSKWTAMQIKAVAEMVAMHTNTVIKYAAMKKAVVTSMEETKNESGKKMDAMSSDLNTKTKKAVSFIKTNFSQTKDAVISGINTAMNAARNVDWTPIGRNIVNGVSAGVRQQASQLAITVRNSILMAAQAAREAAQIHSPSRLFRNAVGLLLGKGIAVGVEDSQRYVMASMYTMTDKLHDTFKNAMEAQKDAFTFPVHEDFSASYTAEFSPAGQEQDTAADMERGMRSANGEVVSALYIIAGQLIEAVNGLAGRPSVVEIDGKAVMQTVEAQQRQRGNNILGGGVLA